MIRLFSSIKFKIIVACIIISTIFSLIVCYSIYRNMTQSVTEEQVKTTGHNLKLVMDNVDQELFQIYRLVLWCSSNSDISHFLKETKRQYTSLPTAISAFDALKAQIFNSSIENYINKLILCTNDNRYLIQGNSYGMDSDVPICKNFPYFLPLLNNINYSWIGIYDEPFDAATKNTRSIPIIRPIFRSESGTKMGWIYISLSPNIMTDKISNYMKNADYDIYWCMDDNVYIHTPAGFQKFDGEISFSNEVTSSDSVTVTDALINNTTYKSIRVDSQRANWYILQTLPPPHSFFTVNFFNSMLVPILIILIISILFVVLLQRIVSRPVILIYNRIKKISAGDFSEDVALERADEFGYIGRGINKMSYNISRLMSDQIETEKTKRELELSLLQSQINPHFLYNTLNTIKWMAVIQNATGISEITAALANLLKNISKNTASIITIREELALLDDYITIQRYRYSDMFEYSCNVTDESLYNCMIMHFSLQPIIENAIFHGIEPKNKLGKIAVTVSKQDNHITISITDNGVGISEDTIRALLSNEQNNDSGVFKKIGLRNVNQRFRLEYGEEYGISIQSELGKYTRVLIVFPVINNETGDETCTSFS